MKKLLAILLATCAFAAVLCGCSSADSNNSSNQGGASQQAAAKIDLEDGAYDVAVKTDSSMFHLNETCDDKAVMTVKDGSATVHITLVSKNIVNLFAGSAEDAQKAGAEILEPTMDKVTYSDGITEEVYGFDVPVMALDEEFECAILGKKGTWYDHTLCVSDPQPQK